jgi:hypothetical protein
VETRNLPGFAAHWINAHRSPGAAPITATNIHYDVAAKTRGIACGGIGAIHLLVRKLGLAEAIDERLHLLKFHLPYHESDHVLNGCDRQMMSAEFQAAKRSCRESPLPGPNPEDSP